MPRSSCDPCCNPTELSRSTEMYRSAHLQILCDIRDAVLTGGSEGVFDLLILDDAVEIPIIAGTPGEYHDLQRVVVRNMSATSVDVAIRSEVGGPVLFTLSVGSLDIGSQFESPALQQTTLGATWTAELQAAPLDLILIYAQAAIRT